MAQTVKAEHTPGPRHTPLGPFPDNCNAEYGTEHTCNERDHMLHPTTPHRCWCGFWWDGTRTGSVSGAK